MLEGIRKLSEEMELKREEILNPVGGKSPLELQKNVDELKHQLIAQMDLIAKGEQKVAKAQEELERKREEVRLMKTQNTHTTRLLGAELNKNKKGLARAEEKLVQMEEKCNSRIERMSAKIENMKTKVSEAQEAQKIAEHLYKSLKKQNTGLLEQNDLLAERILTLEEELAQVRTNQLEQNK